MPRLSEREQIIRQGRAIHARQLRDAGWSLRAIARKQGVTEPTVRRDLASVASASFGSVQPLKRRTKDAQNVVPLRRTS